MRGRFATAAGLMVLVVATGCGSSHHKSIRQIGGTGPPVFSDDLNALCQPPQRGRSDGTTTEAYSQGQSVASFEHYVREFKALVPPPNQRAAYAKFVGGVERALVDFKTGSGSGIRAAQDAEAYALQLGAPACGQLITTGGY